MRIAVWGLAIVMALECGAPAQSTDVPGQPAQAVPSGASDAGDKFSDERSQFEVATIKPSDPAECCGRTYRENGRRFETFNTYLRWLLMWSYGVQSDQIVGAPAWIDQDRYNLSGELEGTQTPNDRQWRVAVRKLLEDRFQLQFHHEIRELSAYALVPAKGGLKLVKSNPDNEGGPGCHFSGGVGQTMRGFCRKTTLHDFVGEVQRLALNRPVVDRTGATGTFDIDLAFTREDPVALGMMQLPDNAAPNLLDALQQQLGLKLEVVKAPVDVLVIDHVEKPSPD